MRLWTLLLRQQVSSQKPTRMHPTTWLRSAAAPAVAAAVAAAAAATWKARLISS